MKKIVLSCILTLLMGVSGFAQGVAFTSGTWEEVLAKAKAENKFVFVDVYTQWCGPCKHVSTKVFPDAKLGEYYNKTFINFKVDAESAAGKEFVKKYPVSGYPTFFYINGEGKVINKVVGGRDVTEFLKEAEMIKTYGRYGGIENMMAAIKNGTATKEMYRDYYESANKREKPKALNLYLKSMSSEELMDPETSLVADISLYDRELENRLADEIKLMEKSEKMKDKNFRELFGFNVSFPVEFQISMYIENSIKEGNRAFLDELFVLKERHGNPLDGDWYVMKGRGLFFATPEYINLCFMTNNRTDGEEFRTALTGYMEKMMQEKPVNSLLKDKQKKLVESLKTDEKINKHSKKLFLQQFARMGTVTAHNIIAWTHYYWRVSPSDKQTKALCSEWIKYAFYMNLIDPDVAIPAADLLAKIGNTKDAVTVLETAIAEQKTLDFVDEKVFRNLELKLRDVKNGKL